MSQVTASDSVDGDLSDAVLIEKIGAINDDNERLVTLAVTNSQQQVSEKKVTVNFLDYSEPSFTLSAPLVFSVSSSNSSLPNFLEFVRSSDRFDGDISNQVTLGGLADIDLSVAGEYPVTLMVTNSAKETVTLPVTLQLYSSNEVNSIGNIELSQYLLYLSANSSFEPTDYLENILIQGQSYFLNANGQLESALTTNNGERQIADITLSIDNPVDTSIPGVYEVGYSYQLTNSEMPSTVKLIVVVKE